MPQPALPEPKQAHKSLGLAIPTEIADDSLDIELSCINWGSTARFTDRCLAATIRSPLGHEHYRLAQMKEDEQPELTVVMILEGQALTLILHNEVEKELAATEGWPAFLKVGV